MTFSKKQLKVLLRVAYVNLLFLVFLLLIGSCATQSTNPGEDILPPVIDSIQYWSWPVTTGDTVTIHCYFDTTLGYQCRWECPRGGLIRWTGKEVQWVALPANENDTVKIYTYLYDRWHVTRDSDTIVVHPRGFGRQPPHVDSVYYSPYPVVVGDTVIVSCFATSPQGSTLSYHWSCSTGGLLDTVDYSVRWLARTVDLNRTVKIYVTVADSYLSVRDSTAITVYQVGMAPLVMDSISTNGLSVVATDDSLTVTAYVGTSGSASTINYQWSATRGTISGAGAQVVWYAPSDTGRTIIRVTASNANSTVRDSTYVRVVPFGTPTRPPVIQQISASPQTMMTADTTTVTCIAMDPIGAPLTYSWSGGTGRVIGSGPVIRWITPAATGVFIIGCTVSNVNYRVAGQTNVTVTPRVNALYRADFSTDQVTNNWQFAGMLAGLGTETGAQQISWDATQQAMSVTAQSYDGTFAFQLAAPTFTDGTRSMEIKANSTEFPMIGMIPMFVDETHYCFFALDFTLGTWVVYTNDGSTTEATWEDSGTQTPAWEADTYYNVKVTKTGASYSCYINNVQVFVGTLPASLTGATHLGVAVNSLSTTGTVVFDNILVTNP